MLILALECSAVAAGAALMEDDRLLAEAFLNVRLTHSQTLMPLTDSLLRAAGRQYADVEGFAVTAGPGSFTGVRIGVAAVKGLAQALERPCVGVSTLEAMACQTAAALQAADLPENLVVMPAMDARCGQIYTARFALTAGSAVPRRLGEDRAVTLREWCDGVKFSKDLPYLVGDGAVLCYNELRAAGLDGRLAPETARYQRAVGAALAALPRFAAGQTVSAADLQPIYLRLPQAERDLKKQKKEA